MAVHRSVLDLIGNTPLVELSELSPNPEVRILAKLDLRDRAAAVVYAFDHGIVTPGQDTPVPAPVPDAPTCPSPATPHPSSARTARCGARPGPASE